MSYNGNMNIPGTHGMDEDEQEMNIYANADASDDVRTETENTDTKRHQTAQHTGSCRRAPVCLLLLCVLLLTAVIVLCVHIHTNNANCTEETHQLLTRNTNLTEEREQLLTRITNLTDDREQLLTMVEALKGQLAIKKQEFTAEKKVLLSKNHNLTKQSEQLNQENENLRKRLVDMERWTCYQSTLYYFSSEWKSWNESRTYCTERGADLIIINNREEQDLVKKRSAYAYFWIGLTDNDEEGRWKWVDGSTLTSGFWRFEEPNGSERENCVVSYSVGWVDFPCFYAFQWVCEKSTLK